MTSCPSPQEWKPVSPQHGKPGQTPSHRSIEDHKCEDSRGFFYQGRRTPPIPKPHFRCMSTPQPSPPRCPRAWIPARPHHRAARGASIRRHGHPQIPCGPLELSQLCKQSLLPNHRLLNSWTVETVMSVLQISASFGGKKVGLHSLPRGFTPPWGLTLYLERSRFAWGLTFSLHPQSPPQPQPLVLLVPTASIMSCGPVLQGTSPFQRRLSLTQ